MITTEHTKNCLQCGQDFVVNMTQQCWWSQKFCSVDCRKEKQNRIRCERALAAKIDREFCGFNKCEWAKDILKFARSQSANTKSEVI